ncbi:MAG: glycogen/starch/alpha-glucan phosphorylase, partial [Candidatus Omnitrophota bacterium]
MSWIWENGNCSGAVTWQEFLAHNTHIVNSGLIYPGDIVNVPVCPVVTAPQGSFVLVPFALGAFAAEEALNRKASLLQAELVPDGARLLEEPGALKERIERELIGQQKRLAGMTVTFPVNEDFNLVYTVPSAQELVENNELEMLTRQGSVVLNPGNKGKALNCWLGLIEMMLSAKGFHCQNKNSVAGYEESILFFRERGPLAGIERYLRIAIEIKLGDLFEQAFLRKFADRRRLYSMENWEFICEHIQKEEMIFFREHSETRGYVLLELERALLALAESFEELFPGELSVLRLQALSIGLLREADRQDYALAMEHADPAVLALPGSILAPLLEKSLQEALTKHDKKSAPHQADGAYTGIAADQAQQQLQKYKAEGIAVAPINNPIAAAALTDALAYLQMIGSVNAARGPPAVCVIDTDTITFGATYEPLEHAVYLERAFLQQRLSAASPQAALAAVFVHELNNHSHLENVIAELGFLSRQGSGIIAAVIQDEPLRMRVFRTIRAFDRQVLADAPVYRIDRRWVEDFKREALAQALEFVKGKDIFILQMEYELSMKFLDAFNEHLMKVEKCSASDAVYNTGELAKILMAGGLGSFKPDLAGGWYEVLAEYWGTAEARRRLHMMGVLYSQAIKGQGAIKPVGAVANKNIIDIARSLMRKVTTYHDVELNMNGIGKVDVEIYTDPYSELDEYWMYCPAVFHEAYPGNADDDFRAVQTLLYRKVTLRFIKEGIADGSVSRNLLFSTSEVNTTLAVPAVVDDEYTHDPDFADVIVHHYNHTIVPAGMPVYHWWMFDIVHIAEEFRDTIHDGIVDLVAITGRVSDFITGCSSAHTEILRTIIFKDFADKVTEDTLFGNSEGSTIARWQGAKIQSLLVRYTQSTGAVDYYDLFGKLDANKELKAQFIAELLIVKNEQKQVFINALLSGTFGFIGFTAEELKADGADLMTKPFFTFVRRLVDYKCVDFIIDVLYDDAFRERIIAADGVLVVGGRKFSEFSDLQQQRIKQLVEKDPRMKFRIIFVSNHNVYTSWMIQQGTSFGGMLSWMGKEAGPTSYANAQQNGAPTFATLDGVIPERLIPITRAGEEIREGTGYAVAYGSERSYSNDIKPDRESFVSQFEAACADYRNAAVYGTLAYNALCMGVTNGDIRNQSKGLLMVWATEIRRIQASVTAAHTGEDGGYTGMPRADALRQLDTYLSGYRHGQVGLSQLPAEIGAAAFKQAVTYLRSIPRFKRWRAPRARVWVIETQRITFGATYDAQGNIFIERAFLNKIQHSRNPSMMLTRVFIHELNGSSHFMNRLKEYLFVLDSFVAKNNTLLLLGCVWGITAVSFAYAVLDYLLAPASSSSLLHVSMGVIFVLGLIVLAEWIARASFGPQSARADRKEFYKWLSRVSLPLFIILSITLMSPVLFGVDFVSFTVAVISEVSFQEFALAIYFFILMLPWLLKTLLMPVHRSAEIVDSVFVFLNEMWKAPRATVTKGKKPAAKRLGDILNYGLIPLGKGAFAALGAAYLASAITAGEVVFGLGSVVEMTVVFALLDILKKVASPAIGMLPKLPKQIISIGLSLTPWILIACMSLFFDSGLQAGTVNEAVFGPVRDFATSQETHNVVLNTCIALIAGLGVSGFLFYKWGARQANKHNGDWTGVNFHMPGCLITAVVLTVLLAGFVIPFVRENCGLILVVGTIILMLIFGGMTKGGESAAKPSEKPAKPTDKPTKPAAPAQPAKAKAKINVKKALILIAVLVILGIILALLVFSGAEAQSLAAHESELSVVMAGFAPENVFGWAAFVFSTLLIGMCARGQYVFQLPAEQESLRSALERSGAIALRHNAGTIKAVSFNGSVINSDKYNRQALELVMALKEAGIELFIVSENADRKALLDAVQRKGFLGLVEEGHIYNVWPSALRSLAVSAGIPIEYLSKWYALNKIKDEFGYDESEMVHLDDTPDVVHEAMQACLGAGVLSRMEHFDEMVAVRPDYLIKDLSNPDAILAVLGIVREEVSLWLEAKQSLEVTLEGLPRTLRNLERGIEQHAGYGSQFTFAVDIPVINEGICFSAGASAKSYVLPEGGIMRAGYLQGKLDTYASLEAYIDSIAQRLLAAGLRPQDVRVLITRTGAPWDVEVRLELPGQSGNLSSVPVTSQVRMEQEDTQDAENIPVIVVIGCGSYALEYHLPAIWEKQAEGKCRLFGIVDFPREGRKDKH